MKKPERKYFQIAGKNFQNCYDDERYSEHLNAFIDYLQKELYHFQNYAVHTEFCTWRNNGNANCNCGYHRTK